MSSWILNLILAGTFFCLRMFSMPFFCCASYKAEIVLEMALLPGYQQNPGRDSFIFSCISVVDPILSEELFALFSANIN
jgi:hypothetical protein